MKILKAVLLLPLALIVAVIFTLIIATRWDIFPCEGAVGKYPY